MGHPVDVVIQLESNYLIRRVKPSIVLCLILGQDNPFPHLLPPRPPHLPPPPSSHPPPPPPHPTPTPPPSSSSYFPLVLLLLSFSSSSSFTSFTSHALCIWLGFEKG